MLPPCCSYSDSTGQALTNSSFRSEREDLDQLYFRNVVITFVILNYQQPGNDESQNILVTSFSSLGVARIQLIHECVKELVPSVAIPAQLKDEPQNGVTWASLPAAYTNNYANDQSS